MLSSGTPEPGSMPWRRSRDIAIAKPSAFGRWLAIVLVCGGTCIVGEPSTLCRPPLIGSSADAQNDSIASKNGVSPRPCRSRAAMNAPLR